MMLSKYGIHLFFIFARSLLILSLMGGWILTSYHASYATVVLHASVEDLTHQADWIVYAEVQDQKVWPKRGSKGEIYTRTTFEVFEYWKGNGPQSLTVQTLGGTLDGLTLHVAGMPHFIHSQKMILFLRRDAQKNLAYIVALSQGVFYLDDLQDSPSSRLVVANESSPNPRVYQDLSDLSFYTSHVNTQRPSREPSLVSSSHLPKSIRTQVQSLYGLKQKVARALIIPRKGDQLPLLQLPSTRSQTVR